MKMCIAMSSVLWWLWNGKKKIDYLLNSKQ
jgi:hypothetical protein